MAKPILTNTEFDFDRGIWWVYFDSENGRAGNPKRFGINKFHYKFQAKIEFGNNEACENYLLKRAQEYIKQFDEFSKIPEEKILGVNDK